MPSAVCPSPVAYEPQHALDAFNKAKKNMPGLTPAAWRKAAAQDMGIDYDTYLSLFKQAKTANKAVKLEALSTPTKKAAEAVAKNMSVAEESLSKAAANGVIMTEHGPLDGDLAKAVYQKMKADMPGATAAQLRHAAAEYLKVPYNDYLVAWKNKGTGKAIGSLPNIGKTPLSPTSVGKYSKVDISVDELKSELVKLYGPGAQPSYISLDYDGVTGVYKVQFPSSILPTPASKKAVADGLEKLGLNVEKHGNTYHISTNTAKKTLNSNIAQIKKAGTYTMPDGKVVLDMNKANTWTSDWWNKLSAQTQQAWKSYTGSGYSTINRSLRGGGDGGTYARLLSKSMETIENEFTVFRGSGSHTHISEFNVGGLWTDPAFLSTAVNPGGAWQGVRLEITMPKGSRGMYIGKKSSHPSENEFLIDKATKFRVISVDKNTNTVRLMAIPKG